MPKPTESAKYGETDMANDKQQATQWARELLAGDFVIFDTETTGFDPDDEIIQIGIINQAGDVVLEQLVKPIKTVANSQYHGITNEMLADAPTFPEVYEQIKVTLGDKTVVAYNYATDSRMLEQVCRKHGLDPILPSATHCAMEEYAAFNGDWQNLDETESTGQWQEELPAQPCGLFRQVAGQGWSSRVSADRVALSVETDPDENITDRSMPTEQDEKPWVVDQLRKLAGMVVIMKRAFILLPLLAVAILIGWFELTPRAVLSPMPSVALAQLPGRGDAGDPAEIACVIIIHANGDRYVDPPGCDEQPTATPWPTFTPSATPGWTPTPTRSASATPTATSAPSPTSTPARIATPMVEVAGCGLVVQEGPLNVRDAPWGTVLGKVQAGDYLYPEGKASASDGTLWIRIYWLPDQAGYVYAGLAKPLEGTDCSRYFPIVRAGPHLMMGEGASAVEPYAAEISAAKCLPGVYQICLKLKQANPAIFIIARPLTDRIALDYHYNALLAWEAVKDAVPAGFDAIELENEVSVPDGDWPQWVQFSITLAGLVARDTGMQYLAFSFGPGNPAYEHWADLLPYLNWVTDHPLPDGRYHGIAIHAAPYATFDRSDMPWVNSLHIAGRIYLARDVLLANTGFDLATWPGLIAVTELGLSDGYSGNWNAPYTCQEAANAYRTTRRIYQEHGYPQIEIWWNFGQLGWHSDDACTRQMFN
jgi:DNA polymerase-3 subunit epsilon